MGVLDIRTRSVNLGNIGGVRGVDTRTGEAEAWGATREAGKGLSDVGNELNRVAIFMQEREDRRQIDAYANRVSEGLRDYYKGSKDDKLTGALYQDLFAGGSNPTKWQEANQRAIKDIKEQARKDLGLSDRQFDIAERSMLRTYEHWSDAELNYITGSVEKNEKINADRALSSAKDDAIDFWDANSDKKLIEANDRMCRVERVNGDEAKMHMLSKSVDYVLNKRTGLFIQGIVSAATEERDPAKAKKVFDEALEALKTGKRAIISEELSKAAYGDDEKHVDKASHLPKSILRDIGKSVEAAKDKWLISMKKAVTDEFAAGQADIMSIPAPTDPNDAVAMRDYHRTLVEGYQALLDRGGDRLKEFAPLKYAVAERAIKGEAQAAEKSRIKANGQIFSHMLTIGVYDPSVAGSWRQLSTSEKSRMADFLYANNEIDEADYHAALKVVSKEVEPLAQKFFQRVTKGMDKKFPKVCEWQNALVGFAFRDTDEAKALEDSFSPIKNTYENESRESVTERWLYGDIAQLAGIVVNRYLNEGAGKLGEAEALAKMEDEFNRLAKDDLEGVEKLSIERRMSLNRSNADNLKARNRSRISFTVPQGMEFSTSTVEKVKGDK